MADIEAIDISGEVDRLQDGLVEQQDLTEIQSHLYMTEINNGYKKLQRYAT